MTRAGRSSPWRKSPPSPRAAYCVTGLYFYPKGVSALAKQVRPSARGELEITDLNNLYLKEDRLDTELLGRGYAWFDTGMVDSLSEASGFVRTVETRQSIQIAALEEIAFIQGWIDRDTLLAAAERYGRSPYGQHLLNAAHGKIRY